MKKRNLAHIARHLGLSKSTVTRWFDKDNPTRPTGLSARILKETYPEIYKELLDGNTKESSE